MSKTATELILITGFLGSGKTAFLQEGVAGLEEAHAAVVINDHGRFKIPSGAHSLLNYSGMEGLFLRTLDTLLAHNYRYILTETPGLTQPWVLNHLVNNVERRCNGALRFRGMICIIDALRFLKLFSTVVSLYEQASYADCFVLTKSPLAEPEDVQRIKNILRMIRPSAPVFILDASRISFKALLSRMQGAGVEAETVDPRQTISKKLKATTLVPAAPVNRKRLELFLHQMVPKTFMIKGFIHLKGNKPPVTVETFEDTFALNAASEKSAFCLGLTFVWKHPSISDNEFIHEWTTVTGVKGSLI
jgi:G3E family GTPase